MIALVVVVVGVFLGASAAAVIRSRRIEFAAPATLILWVGVIMTVCGTVELAVGVGSVTLTIEEVRTGFSDGGYVAVVKFVGEPDRRVLVFGHGERVPDLRPGSRLEVRKGRFSDVYTFTFPP